MIDDPKTCDAESTKQRFAEFCRTIAALRHPETGCPWDLEQDHRSLRRYMIEEAYEAAEAMAEGEDAKICEELGDVLLQVVLNAQIAQDRGSFKMGDVISTIDDKMKRRHPHVFGTADEKAKRSVDQIKARWAEIKQDEKQNTEGDQGYFHGVAATLPALRQSLEIGKRAAKIAFDWPSAREVLQQVCSEVEELKQGVAQGNGDNIREEIGDLLFSLAQLARHYDLDPETVALDANRKFLKRFRRLEELAIAKGWDVRTLERERMETLWKQAKQELSPSERQ